MRHLALLPALAAIALALGAVGCGSHLASQPVEVAPPPPASVAVVVPEPPAPDPTDALIAATQEHFDLGRHELSLGHLEQAKAEFNRALEALLESPLGARSDPRVREQFDRLVDRISSYELSALAEGDGFTEQRYEPASIDELLAESTFVAPPPAGTTKDVVESDLESHEHDIDIPLNAKVLSYVELFQGRLHDYLQESMQRGGRYLPMIQNVFRAEGLPLDLAYVPLVESAFKPNALSRAKAKGVWQFMTGTARENGLKHDWYIDERSDPEKATVAAAKYLHSLNKIFDGDWHLALASYNGGPGRVQRAMKRTRLDDFWALASKPRSLPRETREYVPMILAAMIIARNPTQYGFDVQPEPPVVYDKVALPGAVDLRRVAEWTGVSIDEIQELNPELRRWTTPIRYADYEIKVPPGTGERLKQELDQVAPADLVALTWYTPKRGETVTTVARKLKVNRADLAEANYLTLRSRLAAGQRLIIPVAPTTLLAARTDRPIPAAKPDAVSVEQVVARNSAAEPSESTKLIYRVKRGDTLFSIARLFDTDVVSLKQWNNLRGDLINAGDRLTIFTSAHSGS